MDAAIRWPISLNSPPDLIGGAVDNPCPANTQLRLTGSSLEKGRRYRSFAAASLRISKRSHV